MTGPATPNPDARTRSEERWEAAKRENSFTIKSKWANSLLANRCLKTVVSLPFFSAKSARLHFVPPTSPARITCPPSYCVGCVARFCPDAEAMDYTTACPRVPAEGRIRAGPSFLQDIAARLQSSRHSTRRESDRRATKPLRRCHRDRTAGHRHGHSRSTELHRRSARHRRILPGS